MHSTVMKLQRELVKANERVEELEGQLAKLRKQEPVAHVTDTEARMVWWSDKFTHISQCPKRNTPLYAAPVHAAPAVPDMYAIKDQLTLAETEMINAKAWSAGAQAKRHIDFAMTAIGCAHDLLQSFTQAPASPADLSGLRRSPSRATW